MQKSDNKKRWIVVVRKLKGREIINGFTQVVRYVSDRPLYSEVIKDGQKALLNR